MNSVERIPLSPKMVGGLARRSAKREGGFTLLEMIISLSILAAIAAFLVVAFRLTGTSLERGGEETSGMARLRAGTDILERAIRSADPLPVLPAEGIPTPPSPAGTGGKAPFFRGEAGRIRFLSAGAPSSLSGGGYRLIGFHGGDPSRTSPGLFLSEASPMRAEGIENWEGTEKPRILFSGATDVTFSYSPGPTKEGKWEWEEGWDGREKKSLPAAVRLEFVTPAETGPRRTALVIPVPARGL